MQNKLGYAEAYKDVIQEDAIKIGGFTKAPDYCFRIGGARKFFVEAKKPSINVKDDVSPAFQLRRYAWSAKLPLSILSDFEELAVYDCRIKPVKTDKSSTARVLYLTYEQYADKWNDLASIFARDAILKGSFDKYVETTKGKKGTAEVDTAFLKEIESWRDSLARNLALRNVGLSQRELNYAVQTLIDRIIFLRMCEDRGIEEYGRLMALQNGNKVYERMFELFQRADERYNSGLFHFRDEKGRNEAADQLTPGLNVEDKPLKDIIKNLYYPDSPYEFAVLPADILGQVYEQFLGKVIRLTAGHHAVVEDKPEVKKAGGVYYTPTYIVDYIVENTVGKLLEGKTPKQASKLRILDPACGSGSFLIGAYQRLMDWHRDWYVEAGTNKHTKEVYEGPGGEWRLTTSERKRILLNNIFGVDIDPQAVEVTKLSLLLKVLEGESDESLAKQLRLFHERALPDLGDNIKCGNSLVGPDYNHDMQASLLDDESQYKINPFDWESEYGSIMKSGGFDVIIGNPPYSYRNSTEEMLRPYYLREYKYAEGNYELYKFFVERGLMLLKKGGVLGHIVSATFLVQPSFQRMREGLVSTTTIERLSPLGPKAFQNATVDTTILVVKKNEYQSGHETEIQAPSTPTELFDAPVYRIHQTRFANNPKFVFDYRLSDSGAVIVERLENQFPQLEEGYEFGVGINTGYIRDELVAESKLDERYHPMIAGSGISRYGPVTTKGWIMYDVEYVRSRGELGRTLPQERLLSSEKILVVRTRNLSLKTRLVATIDRTGAYNLNRLSNMVARPGIADPIFLDTE
jgi:type I restriction-modification system DNA methylase subunit